MLKEGTRKAHILHNMRGYALSGLRLVYENWFNKYLGTHGADLEKLNKNFTNYEGMVTNLDY